MVLVVAVVEQELQEHLLQDQTLVVQVEQDKTVGQEIQH